ncbi:MAG: glycosyltransferase family 1 protein [Gemmatimonadales bacterium]|nr:MAG: glycosyltransferase family 1 protein [Gemmatimonadales bacterium]
MKILLHCVYYPPEVGGLESHVAELARGLVEAGHEVRVVTSRSLPLAPAEEVVDGVRIRRTWFPSRSAPGWVLHALGSIPVTMRWARWADVVHAQAFASILPCHLAARRYRRPLVTTLHTSHFLVRARSRRWRPILAGLVRRSDHTLAASVEIARVGEGLAAGIQVEPLTNGVDTDRFRPVPPTIPPEPGTRRIVVPRRLFPKNGVEYLIRALPLAARDEPGLQALLVGDGPERTRLEALAAELGVAERIRFLGGRPHGEMPGLLCSGEVAVFPSLMEATSVAALECMACGVPVVASRVGGLPEIVDREVGRLAEPGDAQSLATALVDLLRDPELPDLGRRARARVVDHWSNARLVKRHEEIYRSVGAGTRKSPEPDVTGTN